jgi:hypothetical protein
MIQASARAAVAMRSVNAPMVSAIRATSVGGDFISHPRKVTSSFLLPPGSAIRLMHNTAPSQSALYLVAGLSVAGVAVAARYGLQIYEKAAAAQHSGAPEAPAATEGDNSAQGQAQQSENVADKASSTDAAEGAEKTETKAEAPKQATSFWGGMFGGQAMAKRFYKGGFEDKMTRREAALILGLR